MKNLRIGLIFSLFLSAIAITSAQATTPKTGTPCSKFEQTINYAGLTYTCVKSGGKLVWNKGAKVSGSITTNSSHSNSQPTLPFDPSKPKEMQSCVPNSPWVIGYLHNSTTLVYLSCGPDGFLHPQDNAPAINQSTGQPIGGNQQTPQIPENPTYEIPESLINSDTSGFVPVLLNAIHQVKERKSQSQGPKIVFDVEPGFPQAAITSYKNSLAAIINSYGDLLSHIKTYYIVAALTSDYAMSAYKQIAQDENAPEILNPNGNVLPGMVASEAPGDPHHFNGGAITAGFTNEDFGLSSFYRSTTDQFSPEWDTNFPWEVKHAIFYALTGGQQLKPCILTPGTGDLFSASFADPTANDQKMLSTYVFDQDTISRAKGTELFDTLNLNLMDDGPGAGAMKGGECGSLGDYFVAPPAVAYLIAKYGLDKEIQYVSGYSQHLDDYQDWFKTVYGLSITDFYTQAAPIETWFKNWALKLNLRP
jgi:hypothetical protein